MARRQNIVSLRVSDRQAMRDLERASKQLGVGLPKLLRPVISKTMTQTKTSFSKTIRKGMNIKAKRINREILKKKEKAFGLPAGRVSLVAEQRIGLHNFSARATRRRGVSYKIKKGGGRDRIPDAFMARGRSGFKRAGAQETRELGTTELVFKRQGSARLPVLALKGPSPLEFVLKNDMDDQVQQSAAGIFAKNAARRIDFELRKRKL